MIVLVLGGARSGKSEVAERLAGEASAHVTYVATAAVTDADADMADRVAAHRLRRPPGWSTVESERGTSLAVAVASAPPGTVLVDSLGTWVAGAEGFAVDGADLCVALARRGRDGLVVVVSEEVGMGVHPSSEEGRLFRDRLGELNRMVSAVADEALLVVAGRTLRLGVPA